MNRRDFIEHTSGYLCVALLGVKVDLGEKLERKFYLRDIKTIVKDKEIISMKENVKLIKFEDIEVGSVIYMVDFKNDKYTKYEIFEVVGWTTLKDGFMALVTKEPDVLFFDV